MNDREINAVERRMRAFDSEHEQALRGIWFLGDVHGGFDHIEPALSGAKQSNTFPNWLVFLGDIEIHAMSLREVLEPLKNQHPSLRFGFIHGNHDADSYAHWECLHDCGDAVALHGQVVVLNGVRIGGLGGNFLGRVWAPPSRPKLGSKAEVMKRGPHAWRDGQRPNPKLNGAIYPADVAALATQRADILITHEAPSCHEYGWKAVDQLARDMGVVRTFHGHTHDDPGLAYTAQSESLGFDARAVDFRRIKNGLGEAINAQSNSIE